MTYELRCSWQLRYCMPKYYVQKKEGYLLPYISSNLKILWFQVISRLNKITRNQGSFLASTLSSSVCGLWSFGLSPHSYKMAAIVLDIISLTNIIQGQKEQFFVCLFLMSLSDQNKIFPRSPSYLFLEFVHHYWATCPLFIYVGG